MPTLVLVLAVVGVLEAVSVGVCVEVLDGVTLGVCVGVFVGVREGVLLGVLVGEGLFESTHSLGLLLHT